MYLWLRLSKECSGTVLERGGEFIPGDKWQVTELISGKGAPTLMECSWSPSALSYWNASLLVRFQTLQQRHGKYHRETTRGHCNCEVSPYRLTIFFSYVQGQFGPREILGSPRALAICKVSRLGAHWRTHKGSGKDEWSWGRECRYMTFKSRS